MSDERESFQAAHHHEAGQSTIVVEGEFDLTAVERFQACVSEALAAHPGSITVDARGLTFIDSSGLQAWLRARDAAAQAGVGFRVRDPSPEVRRVAELAGIENLLTDE
jgi:anti-sigma B factor antagonist